MFLRRLVLSDFRNYASLEMTCPEGLSVFLGQNAQGKSNLLEAIYFISTGKSFRTNKVAELVRWGQDRFDLHSSVDFSGVSHRIDATVGTGSGRYLLDGKPRRGSAVFGSFKAVIFANEDMDVVRQEPATRRRFFDLFFEQIDPEYGDHLADYQRVVRSRNLLLKEERFDQLPAWNELLMREGSWIIWRRKTLLESFGRIASVQHRFVSGDKEDLAIAYQTKCEGDSREAIAGAMERKFSEHALHEQVLKTTLTGPHRDDYEISVGGKTARHFGSEGQKRSAILSLRLAQWKLLSEVSGEQPMVLLDDVLGELDSARQDAFLELIVQSGAQTFIALTQAGEALSTAASGVFRVSAGLVQQEAVMARENTRA